MSKEAALQILQPSVPTAAPIETVPAGTPGVEPEPKKDDLDSSRFASLAKREAKFVSEREAFNKERDKWTKELETERSKLKDAMTPFQKFEELKKTDAVEALKSLGFSETDIFNWMASNEKKEPTIEEKAQAAADARIKEWEKKKADEAEAEAQKKSEAMIVRFKTDLHEHLDKNKEKYEYCAFHGELAEDMAYRAIQQVLKDSEGQDFMTLDEAYEMVEQLYEEEDKAMSTLKKRQPKVEAPAVNPDNVPLKPEVKPGMGKAMTNTATPTSAAMVNKRETSEQKKARLIEKLRRGGA